MKAAVIGCLSGSSALVGSKEEALKSSSPINRLNFSAGRAMGPNFFFGYRGAVDRGFMTDGQGL